MELRNEFENMEYTQLSRLSTKDSRRFGSSGVFRACCQPESLHKGHLIWPPLSKTLPIIQLCHWVSSKSTLDRCIIFTDIFYNMPKKYDHNIILNNCKDKYVIFNDLTPNACSILAECVEVQSFEFLMALKLRPTADTLSFLIRKNIGNFEPVKANQWYFTGHYIFRLRKLVSDIPASLSIHKTVPCTSSNCVQKFSEGSPEYWNPYYEVDDYFILDCPKEQEIRKTDGPLELPVCCKHALLGISEPITSITSSTASTSTNTGTDTSIGTSIGTSTDTAIDTATDTITSTSIISPITRTFSKLQMTSPKKPNISESIILWYPKSGEYTTQWSIYAEAYRKYGILVGNLASRTRMKDWTLQELDARGCSFPEVCLKTLKENIIKEDLQEFIE